MHKLDSFRTTDLYWKMTHGRGKPKGGYSLCFQKRIHLVDFGGYRHNHAVITVLWDFPQKINGNNGNMLLGKIRHPGPLQLMLCLF